METVRAAERGGGGGGGRGQNSPGPLALGAPSHFFWGGAQSFFFGRNISVIRAEHRNFVWKKLGKVLRKQFKRSCPEIFPPEKVVDGGGGEGPRKALRGTGNGM